jgi:hypothetical protein
MLQTAYCTGITSAGFVIDHPVLLGGQLYLARLAVVLLIFVALSLGHWDLQTLALQ